MKYLVYYNVEFSKQFTASSEQDAIDQALAESDATGDIAWDQQATSQFEADEVPEDSFRRALAGFPDVNTLQNHALCSAFDSDGGAE